MELASETWGLVGKVDAVRRRDGNWVAYEHKRGRSRRGDDKQVLPWPSDRVQAIAYAVLLEETLGQAVPEARIRYHADNVTAFVHIDEAARDELRAAIARARHLRGTTLRPPVTENENLCPRCSLAPVCLPEEERLAEPNQAVPDDPDEADDDERPIPKLFPSSRERQSLHVTSPKAHIGRSGETLVLSTEDEFGQPLKERVPIEDIDALVIHGFGQVTTQAIHLCASRGVGVQWMTAGGKFAAGTANSPGRVQQRLRQYTALADGPTRLRLARQLVLAKVETQLLPRHFRQLTSAPNCRGDNTKPNR
jgi:CRISPR-associated protein Cas1